MNTCMIKFVLDSYNSSIVLKLKVSQRLHNELVKAAVRLQLQGFSLFDGLSFKFSLKQEYFQ